MKLSVESDHGQRRKTFLQIFPIGLDLARLSSEWTNFIDEVVRGVS